MEESEKIRILSDKYQKLIVETEDTKEILAEITVDDIKSANNIQVRLTPTYDELKKGISDTADISIKLNSEESKNLILEDLAIHGISSKEEQTS